MKKSQHIIPHSLISIKFPIKDNDADMPAHSTYMDVMHSLKMCGSALVCRTPECTAVSTSALG